jgi:hypothetical protein
MLRTLGAKPKRARQEVCLEDRLNDDPRGGLNDAVANRRDGGIKLHLLQP